MQIFNRFLCCSFGLETETKPQKQKQKKKLKKKKKQKYASEWAALGRFSLSFWPFVHTLCLDFGMAWTESASESHANAVPPPADSPLPPLLPCHAFGYETIETSLQSVHKVFTRTQNSKTEAETNRQTDEKQERRTGKLADTETDNRHSKRYKNCEQIVRQLWLPPSIAVRPGRGVWL